MDHPLTGKGLAFLLRALRSQRGWTRQTVASKAGISAVYLEQLESRQRKTPSLPVMVAISRAYQINPDLMLKAWLRGYDGKKATSSKELVPDW